MPSEEAAATLGARSERGVGVDRRIARVWAAVVSILAADAALAFAADADGARCGGRIGEKLGIRFVELCDGVGAGLVHPGAVEALVLVGDVLDRQADVEPGDYLSTRA